MNIGLLLFDRLTQLDLTGPYEVFAHIPHAKVYLIAKNLDPVQSDRGLRILPDTLFEDVPQLDIFMIPGGPGTSTLLNDAQILAFVRKIAATSSYVTSVCTGALVLGAAGLLRGRRATTHWNAHEFLSDFDALPVKERVVFDLPFVTGGGVTAGIDIALAVISETCGKARAEHIALELEYDPQPPVSTGSSQRAGSELIASVRTNATRMYAERKEAVARASARLRSA